MLDRGRVGPTATYELQSLGAALGDVLDRTSPLQWVVFVDDQGRDLGLQWPRTSVVVFPLTMISKRVEAGEAVSARELYDGVLAEVGKLGRDGAAAVAPGPP